MRPTIKTLQTDWIQLNCEGQIELDYTNEYTEISDDIVLERTPNRSKNFSKISKVIFEGREFATIQHSPLNESWDPNKVILQLHNELNYETGKISQLEHVLQGLGLQYKNITRLDLAGDGLGLLNPLQKMDEGKIKRVGSAFHRPTKKSDGSLHHIQIGTRRSKRMLIGYNKSKELGKSGKGYIKQFWIQSGVEEKHLENMERIELSFKSAYLQHIGDKTYDENGKLLEFNSWFKPGDFSALYLLEDLQFLQKLFVTGCKRMYEFIEKGAKNVARAKRIFKIHTKWAQSKPLERLKAIASKQIKTIKIVTKQMYDAYKFTKARHFLQVAQEIATVNHLELWMRDKLQRWDREYQVRSDKGRLGWISNYWQDKEGEQVPLFKRLYLNERVPAMAPLMA